ncbi:FCD domain-containing protein [Planomonospora corallina]|uniref:FCD domain-containing protein n=1 Tax=Planomonospora corallina TaxID=1806052 RepID=A0ABV8HXZ2_9ACTN
MSCASPWPGSGRPRRRGHGRRRGGSGRPEDGRAGVSLVQHEKIVDAIVARDPAAAEAAMREHLSDVIVQISRAGKSDAGVVALAGVRVPQP